MIYRIRVILDVEDDVLRDIEIQSSASLDELHLAIAQAFGFGGQEMAAFYLSNDQWEQCDELPLLEMEEGKSFAETPLDEIFGPEQHKLLYVYDFLWMWTFFVELMEVGEEVSGGSYPQLIFAQGEVPEEAPEKKFDSDGTEGDISLEDEDLSDWESDDEFY
ncbi:MAG: IS1096 element passenger TnpR family protein [Flavobacteriaceae bacterium]